MRMRISRLDLLRADHLRDAAALDGGDDPLEVEDRGVALVERLVRRERRGPALPPCSLLLSQGMPNICSAVLLPPGTHRLGPANATLVGAHEARRSRREGRPRPRHARHRVGGDARGRRGRQRDERGAQGRRDLAARAARARAGCRRSATTTRPTSIRRSTTRSSSARTSCSARPRWRAPATACSVEGELTLAGTTQPLTFDARVRRATARSPPPPRHADRWGMKPYSALWGALKVLDDVEVALDGKLPSLNRLRVVPTGAAHLGSILRAP